MEKDTHQTEVVFRIIEDEVIAIFPNEIADPKGNVLSYLHVGQHGAASPDLIKENPVATKNQYQPLWEELTGLGYNLKLSKEHHQARADKEAKESSGGLNQKTK